MNTDFFLDAPSPFVLLDAARAMDSPPGLTAWRRCEGVPFWQVLEAAAQAAALQQRVARDFSCHAFLLSVERAPWPAGPLSGTARLDVRVTAQGGSVAASLVRVRYWSFYMFHKQNPGKESDVRCHPTLSVLGGKLVAGNVRRRMSANFRSEVNKG